MFTLNQQELASSAWILASFLEQVDRPAGQLKNSSVQGQSAPVLQVQAKHTIS